MASEGQRSPQTNTPPLEDSLLVCPICLDDLKNAVATPCGHVHCEECLKDYIRLSEDPHWAECPTCRARFSIVTPDPSLIEPKYRPFFSPPLRRVYVDSPQLESYQQRISELEERVHSLTNDKQVLIQQCGASHDEVRAWQEKETNTRVKCHQILAQKQREISDLTGQIREAQQVIKIMSYPPPPVVEEPAQSYVTAIPMKRASTDYTTTYPDNSFGAHPNVNYVPQYADVDNHKRQRMSSQASTSNAENLPVPIAYRPESVGRVSDGRSRMSSTSRSQLQPQPAPSMNQYEFSQEDAQEWAEAFGVYQQGYDQLNAQPGGSGHMG